jgi:hypothetical protein
MTPADVSPAALHGGRIAASVEFLKRGREDFGQSVRLEIESEGLSERRISVEDQEKVTPDEKKDVEAHKKHSGGHGDVEAHRRHSGGHGDVEAHKKHRSEEPAEEGGTDEPDFEAHRRSTGR